MMMGANVHETDSFRPGGGGGVVTGRGAHMSKIDHLPHSSTEHRSPERCPAPSEPAGLVPGIEVFAFWKAVERRLR